jgi:hypothetical protein
VERLVLSIFDVSWLVGCFLAAFAVPASLFG